MIFFKVRWLPWMTLVAGLITLVYGDGSDSSIMWGLFLSVAGGIWCYYAYGNKNKRTSNPPTNVLKSTNTNAQAKDVTIQKTETVHKSNVCASCGNTLTSGMAFCDKCGKRI